MPRQSPPPQPVSARISAAPRALGPTSLADVAALAGVSTGTVSRALTRPEMISEATRSRVLASAERLGYVANGAARALAMRKTWTVGALVPRYGGSSFPTLVQALETALAAEGYTLLLSAPDHARAQDPTILRSLIERGVDAVALLGADQPSSVFSQLNSHRIPFVMMWAKQSNQGACVGFDEGAAAALVIDNLADQGHRQIGFIGGRTLDNERARLRFRGLLEAVARRGLTLQADALMETNYGFHEGFEAMQQILLRRSPVTAVVCGNDYLAAGALSALDRAGIAVPARVSVASFNDNDFAPYLHPPLTTVQLPIRAMGEVAARYLIERLAGQMPELPALLPVELIVRDSTGPVPTLVSKKSRRKTP